MVESEGWAQLKEIKDEQVLYRRNKIIYTHIGEELGLYEQEYMKGEIAGMDTFFKLPDQILENLETTIDHLQKKLEKNERSE